MTSAITVAGLNAGRQIADLRRLQNGWRNGEGVAFDTGYLNWLAEVFQKMYPAHAPAPVICPNTYGVVSAEWSFPSSEVSLEIDPETRKGNLVWLGVYTRESRETELDLTAAEGWASLTEYIV